MRKIQFFAFSAAAALALSMTTSCQKELEQAPVPSSETSTVCFTMSEPDTKTAMGETVDNKVTNVWSSDDNARMTFYQNGTASTKVEISSSDSFKHASFTATFPSATAPYKYKALLAANKVGDLPVVPAVQHPTASSFDPDANVLVGLESESYSTTQSSVNLVYKHAAAISRISFTGIPTGLTIYGVQINASSAIAGAAKSVNYSNGTVDYSDASENTISLIYDSAPSYSEGKFDAYFVTIPGSSVKITDIKLVTDKGTFVKTNSGSTTTTFDVSKFKTVKVTVPTTRTFYKASALENGINFMIVSGTRAMKVNGTNNVSSQTSVGSVANNSLSVTDKDVINSISSLLWTAEASSTSFKLKSGSNYLYRSSSSSSLKGGDSDSGNNTFTYSNNYLMQGTSRYAYYDSGWKCDKTKTSVDIYTSKLPAANAVSFSSEEAEYDQGTSTYTIPLPTLLGASSATYKSSNTNVATVDNSGKITIKGRGTTDITATATVNSSKIYQGGTVTATYTLTVVNSQSKKFYKVDSPENGKSYFMVAKSGNGYYAMTNKFSGTALIHTTGSPEYIEFENEDQINDCIWSFRGTQDWTITNSEQKLKMSTSGSGGSRTYSISLVPSTTTGNGLSWNYQYNHLSSQADGESDHIGYISYSSSKFAAVKSSSSSIATIELYEYITRDVYFSKGGQKITSDSYNIDFGAAYVSPTVAGEIDGATITYSTSDASIATVSSEGVVTINGNRKTGTVTITANIPKTSNYDAATISYTLTVTKKETYVKVTEAPSSWAGTYLILSSDDKKLFDYSNTTSGNSFHAASLTETITDNKIVSSDLAKYEVEIIAFDSSKDYEQPDNWYEATPVTGWKVKVAGEDNTYLYSYGNGDPEKPVQTGIEPTSGRIYYNGIYCRDGEIKMISSRGGTGSAKYLGYHSDKGFYYNSSTSEPSERVHLYKKQ